MKMITRRGIFLWLLSFAFIAGIVFMTVSLVNNGDEWVMKRFNHHVYSNGELVGAGTIYDCDGNVLAETVDGKRVYSDNKTTRKSTLHIVGDPKNFISTGVQSAFDARLTGYNILFGVYNIERYGKGNDLKLTLDSEICNTAYDALAGRKGTVGVVNYKTGDIICAVSSPSYDVNDVPYDLETSPNYEGAYINRLLSAHYIPGSTFKLVTAICALENISDIESRVWDCDGKFTPKSGTDIICNANHGKGLTFEKALAQSCNAVFAQIAIELGEDKLNATAKELGIGSTIKISGVINSYEGKFELKNAADDLLGWTGVGQGKTQLAPITMLRIVSAIANGGSVPSFNIVNSLANQAGNALSITLPTNQVQLINTEISSKMKKLMRNNVKSKYGDGNYKGLKLCAKSGTAQIDNDPSHDTTWFVGFMDKEDCPYAFVVVIENGVSGAGTAGPVANKVMQAVDKKY